MKLLKFIYIVFLFFILTPNILVRLKGNKYIVALIHAIIFAIIYYFTRKMFKHKCKEGLDLYSDSACINKQFVSGETYDFDVNNYQYYFKNNDVCSSYKSNGFYSDSNCSSLKNSISDTDFFTKTVEEGCVKKNLYKPTAPAPVPEPTTFFYDSSCSTKYVVPPEKKSVSYVKTTDGCKKIKYMG